ncbi:helix-turn-helix transcriptional regulator [Propionimicrobium sp. PCR01-08-3]|uniref:helix-turn-helix domain-containing protein n=1 Tax=Propionimicrobium sp. PCR01-08-3 TaxID=3052086 RepID=UPI00255C813E|nr:helix-turn-helix transcriptional regulator [Propionimicrobium sp. PCR01-08-3]WIY82837.1 helix-turn-helix transcriptional regulator [Propionimicrobium sp. PCR01-08-3]
MTTYTIDVSREGRRWVLDVRNLDIAGQTRALRDAADIGRGIVAAYLDIPEDDVKVDVKVHVPEAVSAQLVDAEKDEELGRAELASAAQKRRAAIRDLRAMGISQRDVAEALGMSPQRVSQLVKSSA